MEDRGEERRKTAGREKNRSEAVCQWQFQLDMYYLLSRILSIRIARCHFALLCVVGVVDGSELTLAHNGRLAPLSNSSSKEGTQTQQPHRMLYTDITTGHLRYERDERAEGEWEKV